MKKYLIIPDCADSNRGDQALIWETIRIAEDAGFKGEYYMQSAGLPCWQSVAEGIKLFNPILPHPSRGDKEDNVDYKRVLIKWGGRAIFDFVRGLWILILCRSEKLCDFFLGETTKKTLELFRESSAIFVKGGGFIHSFGGLTAPYFIFYHLFSICLANRMKKKVIVMPNSFGPIDGFLCKWQVKNALRQCDLIFCRERISFEYMTKYFPDIEFKRSYDLGLYLECGRPNVDAPLQDNKSKIAITVRPYRFPESVDGDQRYKSYISEMTGFIIWLIKHNYYPVLIQHTLANNAHEDDMAAIKEITSGLPDGQFDVFSDPSYDCRQMKSLYSHFDYIIGTRFHSVIFSLMEGVPAIAIAYGGNKTRGIMNDIGLGDFVIGIDEVEKYKMINLFEKLIAEKEEIKRRILLCKKDITEEREKMIALLNKYA